MKSSDIIYIHVVFVRDSVKDLPGKVNGISPCNYAGDVVPIPENNRLLSGRAANNLSP